MASISELPLGLRLFLRTYRWRRIDPVPLARLETPLSQAKIALVSTAGLVPPDQKPFDDTIRGGDWSYREIARSTNPSLLIDCHRSGSFDHAGVVADPNLGFPLDRLRELEEEGFIGSLSERHYSMMGSLTATGRMLAHSAPAIASALKGEKVDAVLLVPI